MTDDELRDELAEAIHDHGCTGEGGCAWFADIESNAPCIPADLGFAEAVLPVVRRFADAQVAAERERIAAGLQRLARHVMDAEIDEGFELLDILAAGQLPGLERRQS